ncbi:diphosphomevalonate decarboxylase [Candidatus Roizmanbacteria bacterium CG_4_10_14_0_2_um_filter_39_13]|uniref:diphosphomevalonate decarboxylase n=1 Tax=Candidatus Roizmanbacteria bacterium CG_4_10_14_0_2_um_filter_39_13 TaxID=1974825 RepID=A0A2M7TZB8_9BACT|nr:MAG: diphosphomevalonate decarboxylase [Candidatus Roizmanbacteria bacterium CG_4_10_14_0_2_um_filter_39_13]
MKATAIAHPNVALIKYWGRKDEMLRLPTNGSISINLSEMTTTTTVEFSDTFTTDAITINDEVITNESDRAIKHLDRIRILAQSELKAKVVSKNNFPSSTGLSSSSSGFAALTIAGTQALGLELSEKELSILARLGSGSACRSIPDGWVEWKDAETSEESYASTIFPSDHWNLVDVVAVVSTEKKDVPTSMGQKLAQTSPFFEARQKSMQSKISELKKYISNRRFKSFGEIIEAEALNMHAVMITSSPSLIYWSTGTLQLMKQVQKWRTEGLSAYFTINTGQDTHILVQEENAHTLIEKLNKVSYVKKVIKNSISQGVHLSQTHLF